MLVKMGDFVSVRSQEERHASAWRRASRWRR